MAKNPGIFTNTGTLKIASNVIANSRTQLFSIREMHTNMHCFSSTEILVCIFHETNKLDSTHKQFKNSLKKAFTYDSCYTQHMLVLRYIKILLPILQKEFSHH